MGQSMRVALELQPCCGKRSGIGVYTYELARRLRSGDGLEFVGNLFNFVGRNDNSAALSGISMPIRENRRLPYGIYRRVWNVLPIPYRAMFPEGADLSVFFNYIVPPRISGKVMTTLHDMTYLRFPETMDAKNRRRLDKGLRYSVERSDRILTVSEFSKRELRELLHIPEERVAVVPNAPSIGAETADLAHLAERYGLRQPYLLYVGTIEPRKNLTRLIAAFDRLKREAGIPHQLVLAGGKGWQTEEIYLAAQKASHAGDILFTGYVSAPEKNGLYQNAAAFVFPSLYEGFGIPPLEAMTFGCPVICANAASLPEVVGDAAELVEPEDETSIAEGIWKVISDQARRDELTRRGAVQARKYTWDASSEKMAQVCRAVLEET